MSVVTTLESKEGKDSKENKEGKDSKENKILTNHPGNKCANCGHDVMVYHHPLSSSGPLMFHDNGGIFSRTCSGCKCKDPKMK